jgi:hypothetical protein
MHSIPSASSLYILLPKQFVLFDKISKQGWQQAMIDIIGVWTVFA